MVLISILAYFLIYILGYLISKILFKKANLLLTIVLSFAIGFGAISFIMSILGFLFNFKLSTVAITLTTILIFLVYKNRNQFTLSFSFSLNSKLVVIILPFLLLSFLHIFLLPELYKDSLIYGEWARILYNHKSIDFIEGGPTIGLGFASNYPSAYQLIGVFIYLFTGESLIFLRITSLLLSFLLMIFVYSWSREIFKEEKFSIYSILLLISIPSIIFFSHSASSYLYLTLQFSLACYFLQKFLLEKNKKYLVLSSVFGGFAALTSYLGLLYLLLLPFTIQLEKKFYKPLLFSLLLFLAIISPWYLRNLLVLNNPIWPFAGGKFIDPIIQANSFTQLHGASKSSGFNYDSPLELKNSLQRLLFSYLDYYNASVYHSLNPIFILFAIPAIFYWLTKKDKNLQFFLVWFLLLLTFYLVAVNYFERYLILLSVPTVFLSVYMISLIDKFKPIKWLLIVFFVILFINSLYLALFWDECQGGKESFSKILQNLGNHQKILEICYGNDAKLWQWVNENLPENKTIAVADFRLYYFNKTVIETNSWKLRNVFYTSEIRDVVSTLKENNITYIIIFTTGDIDKHPEYFRLIKDIGGKRIYELV